MNENLINKYLGGELSDEEVKKLHDWVTKDDSNRKYFAQVKSAWTAAALVNDERGLNINKETELFNYRRAIQQTSGNQTYRIKTIHSGNRSSWNVFLKVAALLLLFYSLGITTYNFIVSRQVAYNEVVTRNGEKSQLTLADGSKIWLNSNTRLRYPVQMDAKHVNLYLEGEAFFDVNKIPGRSITVNTSDLKIDVLGTAFNVKSYSEDGIAEATLVRGKITIDGQQKKLKQQLVLQPNQHVTYIVSSEQLVVKELESTDENVEVEIQKNQEIQAPLLKKEPKSKMILTEKVDTDLFTSWKDGKLVFKSERFEDLALRMERWYDVKIEITDHKLKDSRYTGTFEKESIEQALKALSLSLPFVYEIDQNNITIKKKQH